MDAIGIGRSGLQASMARMTASASNIANAHTTGAVPAPGQPLAAGQQAAYQPLRAQLTPLESGGVAATIVASGAPYRLTYDPRSRQADAQGMVAAPDVDIAGELVEQLTAKLDFAANLKVVTTMSSLEKSTLERWG